MITTRSKKTPITRLSSAEAFRALANLGLDPQRLTLAREVTSLIGRSTEAAIAILFPEQDPEEARLIFTRLAHAIWVHKSTWELELRWSPIIEFHGWAPRLRQPPPSPGRFLYKNWCIRQRIFDLWNVDLATPPRWEGYAANPNLMGESAAWARDQLAVWRERRLAAGLRETP